MSRILTGLDDSYMPPISANEMIVVKEVSDTLMSAYPGHQWGVNIHDGTVNIFALNLSGRMGTRLHLKEYATASEMKRDVMRKAGEILERYRVNRGRLDEAQYTDLKTDFAGNFYFDK